MKESHWSPDIYLKTYKFAAQAHNEQKVPGSDLPYIVHISLVSMEMIAALEHAPTAKANLGIQCALLHDILEDTEVTYDELNRHFGSDVAKGVLALTKDPSLPKGQQMMDSLARIKNQPWEVRMVKMADRITNLQPPPSYWSQEKIKNYRDEALLIHEELKTANDYLANRLLKKIKEY